MSHVEKESSGQCNDSVESSGSSSSSSSFEIGTVMEKVDGCKYANSRVGTLLIASEAISFQSHNNNFFGMFGNPRLILPFKSITDIYIQPKKKSDNEIMDNNNSSSCIIIKLENDKEHTFSDFPKNEIDKKLQLLKELLSKHDHTTTTTSKNNTHGTTQHSSNSDHNNCKTPDGGDEKKRNKLALFNAIQEEIDGTGENDGGVDVDSAVKEALMISKSMKVCMENMSNETNNDDIPILSGGKIGETEEDYLAIATIAAMAEFRSVSRYISDKKKALRKLEDDLKLEEKKKESPPPPPTQMKTAWSECRESMIHSFKESVVEVSPNKILLVLYGT